MPPIVFSPYGNLTEQHLTLLRRHVVVPADWRPPAGFPGPVESHFESYLDTVIKVIDDTLWPVYDSDGWPAHRFGQMEALTRLDLKVQQQAATHFDDVVAKDKMTHCNLFQLEDGPEDFGVRFCEYDDKAKFRLLETIKSLSKKGQDRKLGWSVVRLKQLFQRPRLYQTSLMLGNRDFQWQEAVSSLTPALPSGHALQGMLFVGAAVEQLLNEGEPITDPLRQYMVDPGDRRVMAGVHYPSDNLASWLMILLSAPFVFRNPGVKEEFWKAIQLSRVYGLMKQAGAEYASALKALDDAYSGALGVATAIAAKTE